MKYRSVRITGSNQEQHLFEDVQDLRINTDNGIIEVVLVGGSFVMLLDMMTCFEVEFPSPQKGQVKFKRGLVEFADRPGATARMEQVINFEWKTEQGLLMIFGKKATLGINLDHVAWFRLEGPVKNTQAA